jgi:hypothetical protein
LREGYKLQVSETRVLRKTCGPKKDEIGEQLGLLNNK